MNLQEDNKELKATIEELEQLRELADEVEESQAANETKLRSELCKFKIQSIFCTHNPLCPYLEIFC